MLTQNSRVQRGVATRFMFSHMNVAWTYYKPVLQHDLKTVDIFVLEGMMRQLFSSIMSFVAVVIYLSDVG